MPTTHRSELVDKVTNALMDEAYDGGMGPMSEVEFPRHVRRLAETAIEALDADEDERRITGERVDALSKEIGIVLMPWQRDAAIRILSGERLVLVGGRRGGVGTVERMVEGVRYV